MSAHRLNLLLIAPNCDGHDVGEAFWAQRWIMHLSERADVTLLTQRRAGRVPASEQLPNTRVIEWDEPVLPRRLERLGAMLKPAFPIFASRARSWIGNQLTAGRSFDIIHQLTPLALRYASPASSFDIPYILGPHGGSLSTPAPFSKECNSAQVFTRLRELDGLRLAADPWLRRSFSGASCVIGVAPYVKDLLRGIPLQRFEVMSELGIEGSSATSCLAKNRSAAGLRLLHVARAVRTKGLRDCIRALGHLSDLPDIHLTQAGDGEELEICRQEANRLGVADRVTFHGRLARASVEELYGSSDVFVFPSFREASGGVVLEALSHGLPVITVDRGGPGHVVTSNCGIKVAAEDPSQLSNALAGAIRSLAVAPQERARLSLGASRRAFEIGAWPGKISWLLDLYHSILRERANNRRSA